MCCMLHSSHDVQCACMQCWGRRRGFMLMLLALRNFLVLCRPIMFTVRKPGNHKGSRTDWLLALHALWQWRISDFLAVYIGHVTLFFFRCFPLLYTVHSLNSPVICWKGFLKLKVCSCSFEAILIKQWSSLLHVHKGCIALFVENLCC